MNQHLNANDLTTVVENDKAHIWHHLSQHAPYEKIDPRIIVEGKGMRVWDQHGKEHIDAVSGGVWTVNVGYGRESIANAVRDQLIKLNYFAQTAGSIPGSMFAEKLLQKMPGLSRVYYANSGSEANEKVFDSDADIVDHQVAIIEYENGATLAFHTNMRVPDEFRRFAVMGTNGMVEGDFVRGFLKAHDQQNNIILDEDYGAAFGMVKGHYGADNLMLKDINQHLTNSDKINLPVGIKDCIEAGVVAMKLDESRKTGKIIDLTSSWNRLDKEMKK